MAGDSPSRSAPAFLSFARSGTVRERSGGDLPCWRAAGDFGAHLSRWANIPIGRKRLLNEISSARVCLLNPARKEEYDAELQREQQGSKPPPLPARSPLPAVNSPPMPPPRAAVLTASATIAEPPRASDSTAAPLLNVGVGRDHDSSFGWGKLGLLLGATSLALLVVLMSLGGLQLSWSWKGDGTISNRPGAPSLDHWATGYADIRLTKAGPIGVLKAGQAVSPDLSLTIESLDSQLLGLQFAQDDGTRDIRFTVQQGGFVLLLMPSQARATERLSRLGWTQTNKPALMRSGDGTTVPYEVLRREVRKGEVHTVPLLNDLPRFLACNELPGAGGG